MEESFLLQMMIQKDCERIFRMKIEMFLGPILGLLAEVGGCHGVESLIK
jgi:hypothetical protein